MSAGSPAAEDADALLLRDLKAGRREAFDTLYRRYSGPVYSYCARLVGDREEAKDLTHDVFVKALRRLPDEASASSLRPWMYRVATNTCFDALRRRHLRSADRVAVDRVATPIDEFRRSDEAALIEQALAGLNLRYRTALVLRDLHGLEPREIAEVLRLPRATADVLVHRARVAFRRGYAALAGGDRPAAAGLILAPLGLPAALQAAPSWPATAAPTPPPIGPEIAVMGPAGGGLLAKSGASMGAKVAAAAATAVLAAGVILAGGLAERDGDALPPSTPASSESVVRDARDLPKTSHVARAALLLETDAPRPVHDTMEMADHMTDARLDDAMHDGDTVTTDGATRDAKSVSDAVEATSEHVSRTHDDRSGSTDMKSR
ncbi:MAG: sigma-70 family RNA polymerase sigma factor [Thermoleophilia bacterium]|nr:sigma-70 family RNA polymerase sigma factor [Thermoleophilia bacterium]